VLLAVPPDDTISASRSSVRFFAARFLTASFAQEGNVTCHTTKAVHDKLRRRCGSTIKMRSKNSYSALMIACGSSRPLSCKKPASISASTSVSRNVTLPVRKLVEGGECRFGVDIVRHCANNLMRKVTASIRQLRIENTVVILVHGIRTRAIWQGEVRKALESSGLVAIPTNYNKFDVVRFLLPFETPKLLPVRKVEAEVRSASKRFPDGHISLLAHSFGTYISGKLLSSAEHKFDRIVFCGSVLRSDFDFASAEGRFSTIINEIGCRDIWPALAATISRSYGPTGSFGFNRGNFVEDRKHAKYGHSHFLNREFCVRFWCRISATDDSTNRGTLARRRLDWYASSTGFGSRRFFGMRGVSGRPSVLATRIRHFCRVSLAGFMKISTWNINGLRSCVRAGFENWLASSKNDVVCLQEVKTQEDLLASVWFRGYTAHWFGADRLGYIADDRHVDAGCVLTVCLRANHTSRAATAAASGFAGTIGGWHWRGRSGLDANWCIQPPSPGGEATRSLNSRGF
jgi:hypothetical protein